MTREKTIPAAKFKEKCLEILDQVDGEGVVITKHGRPVARLVSISESHAHLIGSLKDRLQASGDLLSTGEAWDAQS
jgi:prevent-host-death family protein